MATEPDNAVQPPVDVQHHDEVHPCPGHRVIARCDLPAGTHEKTVVRAGTGGEIVRTPAYFSTTYSIRFRVHDRDVTLHRINRHEFRIEGQSSMVRPGFPPARRYPQPRPVGASPSPMGDDLGSALQER